MTAITAKQQSKFLINKLGKEGAKIIVSTCIEDLTKMGFAHTNINQLKYWIKVLDIILK